MKRNILKVPRLTPRDPYRTSIIPRKKGGHEDVKKEEARKKCRKKEIENGDHDS